MFKFLYDGHRSDRNMSVNSGTW